MPMRVVYLHGFASSPQSSKAQFFGKKFSEAGVAFEAPELDRGDFENLTVTGQLQAIDEAVSRSAAQDKVVLMGSSLGGYLAALYAGTHPETVDRLVLMAPAFEFLERWRTRLSPDDLAEWQRQGWAPIFHYGSKSQRRLGHQFLDDGAQYPSVPDFSQSALILHGIGDLVVPYRTSSDFAATHPAVRLVLLNSGHELTDVLDDLWRETAAFLQIIYKPAG
jgi:hypothetical protein